MSDKKKNAFFSCLLGGVLILIWGIFHGVLVPIVNIELTATGVDQGFISLITLSYCGVAVMISINGLLVIYSSYFGIKNAEKWGYFTCLSQGIMFSFVTILLITLQPRIAILIFSADFILILAIVWDLAISVLILGPLLLWYKELK